MYPYNTYNESIHGTSKTLHLLLFPFSIFCFSPVSSDTYINAYTRICEVYISRNTLVIHNYTKRYSEIRARVCYSFIFFFSFCFSFSLIEIYIYQWYVDMLPIKKKETRINEKKNIYMYIYTYNVHIYNIHIYIVYTLKKIHLHELQRTEYWFNG